MARNFGIMSARTDLGGYEHPPARYGADTRADDYSILLSTYAPLPRSQFTQAVLDVLTVIVWMLLGVLGVAAAGGPFLVLGWILFFS